ncbi:hypothetical protein Taro_006700 [Colocasia esculenta]|uniref:CCHC-type domain-containing protein n=1 Tax=Colocasia esculenta TaxID=4460 RepID=A0A843U1L5_COLES|nr:hypothetical protein [Colocasia esculenta]
MERHKPIPQPFFPCCIRTPKTHRCLNTLHPNPRDEFRTCWGRVEELLVAGELWIIHKKLIFFSRSSATTCTNHQLEVDQRAQLVEDTMAKVEGMRGKDNSKPVFVKKGAPNIAPTFHNNNVNNSNKRPNTRRDVARDKRVKMEGTENCKFCDKLGHRAEECWKKLGACLKCRGRDHRIPNCPILKDQLVLDHNPMPCPFPVVLWHGPCERDGPIGGLHKAIAIEHTIAIGSRQDMSSRSAARLELCSFSFFSLPLPPPSPLSFFASSDGRRELVGRPWCAWCGVGWSPQLFDFFLVERQLDLSSVTARLRGSSCVVLSGFDQFEVCPGVGTAVTDIVVCVTRRLRPELCSFSFFSLPLPPPSPLSFFASSDGRRELVGRPWCACVVVRRLFQNASLVGYPRFFVSQARVFVVLGVLSRYLCCTVEVCVVFLDTLTPEFELYVRLRERRQWDNDFPEFVLLSLVPRS